MMTEIQMLIWSIFLGLAQIFVASAMVTRVRGLAWNASARDTPQPLLSGVAGRCDRALQNYKETFPLFAAAVLCVAVLDKSTQLSQCGAVMYFASRLIYFPVYALGIAYLRTLVWLVGAAGIFMVAWTALCNCG